MCLFIPAFTVNIHVQYHIHIVISYLYLKDGSFLDRFCFEIGLWIVALKKYCKLTETKTQSTALLYICQISQ